MLEYGRPLFLPVLAELVSGEVEELLQTLNYSFKSGRERERDTREQVLTQTQEDFDVFTRRRRRRLPGLRVGLRRVRGGDGGNLLGVGQQRSIGRFQRGTERSVKGRDL